MTAPTPAAMAERLEDGLDDILDPECGKLGRFLTVVEWRVVAGSLRRLAALESASLDLWMCAASVRVPDAEDRAALLRAAEAVSAALRAGRA